MSILTFRKGQQKTNTAIALTSRRVPYLPELRFYCKSVTASLLMTQLEYRFAGMPEGFYKFLSPCEHQAYRVGDSWCEELHFSECEFRSAFDNIGIRYRSKKILKEKVDSEEDPFDGKPYLSYTDVKSGVTYYLRNHTVANEIIEGVLNNFEPQFDLASEANPSEVLEPKKIDFQSLINHSSRNTKKPVVIKKQEKTTEDKQTAAAGETSVNPVVETKQPIAAAVYLTAEDALINATLTVPQHNLVLEESLELTAFVPNTTLEQLAEQIQQTLLNPNAFKQAGIDFMHKLNSIKQVIRKRQWTPPAKHLIEQQLKQQTLNERRDREIREAQLQLSTAKSSLARWIDLEKHAYKKNNLNDVQHLKKMQSHAMQHIEKSQENLRKIHEKYAILDKSQQTLTSAYASNEQKDFDNVA